MAKIYIRIGQSLESETGNFYQVQKFLGQGGNAYSYLVICTSGPHRGLLFVAKVLYNLSSPKRIERFEREANFLKTTTHPSLLKHHDSGKYIIRRDNTTYPFIITNYMPDTLEKRITERSIDFNEKILFSCNLLNALIYMRDKNIIHRDIKPGNIFIDNHNAILGDFGLIKDLSCKDPSQVEDDIRCLNDSIAHGEDGYVAMPYFYRTPELVKFANGKDTLHIESDVFQLGLVLAEMFTGKNPLVPGDIKSPVVLNKIGYINDAGKNGGLVFNSIKEMLSFDYSKRPHPNQTLDHFLQIYDDISK
ncbi:MAG: protein kinase [Lentisphaeria bacterium]|nr:protein kinase [Lentisphaeria bacterium]